MKQTETDLNLGQENRVDSLLKSLSSDLSTEGRRTVMRMILTSPEYQLLSNSGRMSLMNTIQNILESKTGTKPLLPQPNEKVS